MILLWLLNLPIALGQDEWAGRWLLFSELSPTSRTNAYKKLPQAQNASSWEWRNRFGKMVTPNWALGVSAGVRTYNTTEQVSVENNNFRSDYMAEVSNTLWQGGIFATRFFQLTSRLDLQVTPYATYEQGRGSYEVELIDFNCPVCFAPGANFRLIQDNKILDREVRERNFYAGLDLGLSYALNSSLALQGSVNMFQYETHRSFFPPGMLLNPERSSYRPVHQQGDGFSSVFTRPIMHFGLKVLL